MKLQLLIINVQGLNGNEAT
jgi:hypothetical protein